MSNVVGLLYAYNNYEAKYEVYELYLETRKYGHRTRRPI